jgi:hypothetical protein
VDTEQAHSSSRRGNSSAESAALVETRLPALFDELTEALVA